MASPDEFASVQPNFENIAEQIHRKIRPPKEIVYEGCHWGIRSKTQASFESHSRFLQNPLGKPSRVHPLLLYPPVKKMFPCMAKPLPQKGVRGVRSLHLKLPSIFLSSIFTRFLSAAENLRLRLDLEDLDLDLDFLGLRNRRLGVAGMKSPRLPTSMLRGL